MPVEVRYRYPFRWGARAEPVEIISSFFLADWDAPAPPTGLCPALLLPPGSTAGIPPRNHRSPSMHLPRRIYWKLRRAVF